MKEIKNRLLTAESVSPGHPDKTTDYIVDSILDEILKQDPDSRVAIDGVFKDKFITLGGEITTKAKVDYEEVIRRCVKEIGYEFEPEITLHIYEQSPDIALGTNDTVGGAGDQGTITGYACKGRTHIPLEKAVADEIMRELFMRVRPEYPDMKSDMKSQVTLYYDENGEVSPHTVIVACQHSKDYDKEEFRDKIKQAVNNVLFAFDLPIQNYDLIINGTGEFTIGGPEADSGEVGRKIVVDAYGVSVPVGGGTFNGKDPSKVDRTAAYYARYIAKNLVATGLVDECLITVSYCIGLAQPISVDYNFFGTEKVDRQTLIDVVEKFTDYTPKGMIEALDLKRPIYAVSGLMGHFGKKNKLGLDFSTYVTIPWEQLDLAEKIGEYFY